jgi:uncharacterized protein
MSSKSFDPRKLDVAAFAAAQGELDGHWPLASLERLAESVLGLAPGEAAVIWHAHGRSRPVTGGEPETWMHVVGTARVEMRCQRCLGPVALALEADRTIRFVRGAERAEALDAESEDDVLELVPRTDLRGLIEDELLLALPLVPRHDVCPEPLSVLEDVPDEFDDVGEAPPHPFSALQQLKKK